MTLSGVRTLNLAAGMLTVGGPINGSGASLNVTGVGGLVLGGANNYNSGTFILRSNNVTAIDNNSPLGSELRQSLQRPVRPRSPLPARQRQSVR